jgi:phasin family protein
MSTPIPEQLATAQKVGLEALFGLTTKALGSIADLAELNWQVVKLTLAENQEFLTKAYSAKQPQELLSLMAATQPAVDKAISYGRQVSEIVSKAQGEFSATSTALFQQYQRDAQALLEPFAKNIRPEPKQP